MSRPALILEQGPSAPAGVLGEWLADRDIPMEVHRAESGEPHPDPEDYAFVAVLGSRHSPSDMHERDVAEGARYLERVVEADVPVLGLCYGGQLLAAVLGGSVEQAPGPELGWQTIDSDAPDEVPAGPWLQWHFHRFVTPPGATELARNAVGPQAFRQGPHLGVQFHPEATIEIVAGWARKDVERLAGFGVADAETLLEEGRDHVADATRNAYTLFDGFWERARRRGDTNGAP